MGRRRYRARRHLTNRWSGRVRDKVPSSYVGAAPLSSTVRGRCVGTCHADTKRPNCGTHCRAFLPGRSHAPHDPRKHGRATHRIWNTRSQSSQCHHVSSRPIAALIQNRCCSRARSGLACSRSTRSLLKYTRIATEATPVRCGRVAHHGVACAGRRLRSHEQLRRSRRACNRSNKSLERTREG